MADDIKNNIPEEELPEGIVELTDEDGNIQTLEYIMSLEIDGQEYRAFFPTEAEGEEEDQDAGLIILKVIQERQESVGSLFSPILLH
mgnify:CR=1 FL=1